MNKDQTEAPKVEKGLGTRVISVFQQLQNWAKQRSRMGHFVAPVDHTDRTHKLPRWAKRKLRAARPGHRSISRMVEGELQPFSRSEVREHLAAEILGVYLNHPSRRQAQRPRGQAARRLEQQRRHKKALRKRKAARSTA